MPLLIGKEGVGRAVHLLTVFCLLTTYSDAAKLDKLSDLNNIFDDIIEQHHQHNEANEIDDNIIYKSNNTAQSSVEISAEVEEEKRKGVFSKNEDNSLGMDTLTIIWYLTTFTALFGFFVVMACTENSCQRRTTKPPDARTSPPTPCPSYKNFAPPSYGSVMKKLKNQKIFIVPVHDGDNNFFSNPLQNDTAASATQSTTSSVTNQINVDIEKNVS